jgi:ATP-dependent RNA helicase DeaD
MIESSSLGGPPPKPAHAGSAPRSPGGANAPVAAETEAPIPRPTFDALALSPDVRQAVDALGYVHPTPVQLAVFEPAVRGKNLVVQARTGTGKTAAFGIPIVDQIVRRGVPKVQALVLTPTRELALQVAREIESLGVNRGVRVTAIYGGAPMGKQIDELAGGAQVVSGTPGRVLDHIRRKTLDTSALRVFVLDEADEMLSMGFAKELHAIVDSLPKERQGLFFSATIPPDIERLARSQLSEPEFITLSSDQVGALEVAHYIYMLRGGDKRQELVRILETEDPESALVFCNTKDETQRVTEVLQNKGFDAEWLNGDLEQRERERIMAKTREGKLRFLVATDVAARGIDVSHLTHVINADFPETAEGYVHRTGRTGRAGRTGTAISIVQPKDIGNLYILRLTYKIRPIERQLPTPGELKTRLQTDLVTMFSEAFAERPTAAEDLALARRLLTHPDGEKIVAGLVRDHLGAMQAGGRDAATEASESRRAKNPPPVASVPSADVATPAVDTPPTKRATRGAESPPRRGRSDDRPARVGEAPRILDKGVDRGVRSEPRGEPAKGRRGRMPHASFANWEPPAETDDDQPIFADITLGGPTERPGPPSPGMAAHILSPPIPPLPPQPGITVRDAPARTPQDEEGFAQIFVNVGRREGTRPADLQRVLESAGLSPAETGRIRVRDRNSFISVKKELVERAVAAFSGQIIGGRPVVAEPARARDTG